MADREQSSSAAERLALLYHLAQAFTSSLDLEEVLNRVMDEVITAVRAERGFVMLVEGPPSEGTERKLAFQAARGMDQQVITEPRFQVSLSVVERVASQGEPVLTSDAQTDDRFNIRHSVMFLGLRSILCVPLKVKEKVTGVIYVDNRLQAGIFTQADLELLNAIASSAAIAIENARLYQVAVEKGRMERELQMARKVQTSLLPASIPQAPGWEFAARWKPAREVGGDYYDFIACKDGRIGLVIADVTDKGMPAALFMASSHSIIRASFFFAASPADTIIQANRLLCDESNDGLFVTLFFAQIRPPSGEMVYVNAGHNPALLYQSRNGESPGRLTPLIRTGMPLGVEPDTVYGQQKIDLLPGDFIIFYTDGVTEAINAREEEFGMERLEKTVLASRHLSAAGMIEAVVGAVSEFAGADSPFDDITVMVARRHNYPGASA
jgi:sigma-B regulation protein RsbU (phosphoserine phosphatase)